jgi:hypothetical protein
MKEYCTAKGRYHIEGFDVITGQKVFDQVYDNVLVQNFFTSIFEFLDNDGTATQLAISHFASGTGTNTATKADTQLQTEAFRKSVTSKSYTNTVFTVKAFLASSESNFTITEIAIFAGGSATANSGNLISRCNCNIEKNSSTQYTVNYTIDLQ